MNRLLLLAPFAGLVVPVQPAVAETVLQGELSCEAAHGEDLLGQIECLHNRGYEMVEVEGSCTWPNGQVMRLDQRDDLLLEAESRCLGVVLVVENQGAARETCTVIAQIGYDEVYQTVYLGPLPSGRLAVLEAEDQYATPNKVRVDCED